MESCMKLFTTWMFSGGKLKLKGSKATKKQSKDKPVQPMTRESKVKKTATELQLEKRKKEKLNDKIQELASKTHKEQVAEYNKYLASLTDFNEMPRLAAG
ncbi:hypothetical protein EDD86DRAFT_201422 [Gorgonomyces haynaldii]|nr:hypothetical protein EDD86DRAFT_201422 [Gorgonomyces haynaldii]